jgi:hypothetical protein
MPLWKAAITGNGNPWFGILRDRVTAINAVDAERAALLKRSVELPAGILDNDDAKAAIGRASNGQKLWPLFAIGRGDAKALISDIKLDGVPLKDGDRNGWQHVAEVLANALRQREVHARWDALSKEIGVGAGDQRRTTIEFCGSLLTVSEEAKAQSVLLSSVSANAFNLEMLSDDPGLCSALAHQIRAAATSARLAGVEQERRRVRALFENGSDRTSALVRQLLDEVIGKGATAPDKIVAIWSGRSEKRLYMGSQRHFGRGRPRHRVF